ncbi:GGDEF domain-containing protein [Fusibacter bizertensis]
MDLTNNIILNIYSIIFLIIIYIYAENNDDKFSLQHKLYMKILMTTILLLFIDIFSRFDGNPDSFYPTVNYWGNLIIFLLNPVLPSLWLLYVHFQVYKDERKTIQLMYLLIVGTLIFDFFVILNQFYEWFYYIDIYNIYHRGSLFIISALPPMILIFCAFCLVIIKRKCIERRHFYSLIFFAIPPFVSIVIQIKIYGISIMLNSIVFSILVVLLNIQNKDMHTDYLTGVYNRKKLTTYLKKKIDMCTHNKTFSAIMLDINHFKKINDTFGHEMGDKALISSAAILKSCIKSNDLLARFGGDEFIIIMNSSNLNDLEECATKIRNSTDRFNKTNPLDYELSFSMGYAVYDYNSHMTAEEFQNHIDLLMYSDKECHV